MGAEVWGVLVAALVLGGYARYAHALAAKAVRENAVLTERVAGINARVETVEGWAQRLIAGLAELAPRIEGLSSYVARLDENIVRLGEDAREQVKEAKEDRHGLRGEVQGVIGNLEEKMDKGFAEMRLQIGRLVERAREG